MQAKDPGREEAVHGLRPRTRHSRETRPQSTPLRGLLLFRYQLHLSSTSSTTCYFAPHVIRWQLNVTSVTTTTKKFTGNGASRLVLTHSIGPAPFLTTPSVETWSTLPGPSEHDDPSSSSALLPACGLPSGPRRRGSASASSSSSTSAPPWPSPARRSRAVPPPSARPAWRP